MVADGGVTLYTDFRYTVMAERTAPWLDTRTMWKGAAEVKTLQAMYKEG